MKKHGNLRISFFLIIILIAASLILYRLFILSVVKHSFYAKTLEARDENINNLLARGNIYFSEKNSHDYILAATNKKFPVAHVVPSEIKPDKADEAARILSEILGTDQGMLLNRINSRSDSLKVVGRYLDDHQVEAIKELGIKGLGISYETNRFYPGESMGANVIGFLGYDTQGKQAGQYGIEGYYEQELSGRFPGLNSFTNPVALLQSVRALFNKEETAIGPQNLDRPSDIVLTVDRGVQVFIEDKLKNTLKKWEAEKGTIIVQEPETGKIIAMADWPSFNPNAYSESETGSYLNRSVQEVYEPGSSLKPMTMAIGIDLSKITPESTYDDKGLVEIAGYPIRNYDGKAHGVNTMTQVLEKSLNTGTMHVENLIGDEQFLDYLLNMGFGQRTGIDLPGEVSGDITNLYSGRKINYLTASFGQGIAVTPLQLINAYSAIANGGKLLKPYVVSKIIKEGGEEVVMQPEIISIPISEKTAVKLQTMLVSVVDKGFDKARIPGYDVAGKTGTAQMPEGGGYSEKDFIHNFVGFAPAYDARFVILIKIDKPRGIAFASDSLSPTFKEIAQFLLNYYNIPPSRQ